jgi:hypothetical protein
MGKYHNRFLFDLCGDEIAKCLARLEDQSKIYESRSAASRWKMRTRALFVAAFTLNATAIWTAKLLTKGTFSMVTQFRFFKKRWRLDPVEWGQNAKSCFARALSGHSVGQDACLRGPASSEDGPSPKECSRAVAGLVSDL